MRFVMALAALLVTAAQAPAQTISPAAAFRDAIARAEVKLGASEFARTPEGARATAEFLAGLIEQAWTLAGEEPNAFEPIFYGSGSIVGRPGLFNPDNHYLTALLEPGGAYRITGRRGSHAQLSLQVLDGPSVATLGQNRGVIDPDALGAKPGDEFELWLGGAQRAGHWFPLAPDARAMLVRMTFADWERESPSQLAIERLDTPPLVAAGGTPTRLERAAAILDSAVKLWIDDFIAPRLARIPENTVTPLRPTGGDGLEGQYSSMGRFALADDEVLVITVPRSAAKYQAIQLGDPWFVSIDWVRHQSSLNHTQARADADGKLRFVVARRDPGVPNWLDTGGHARGFIFLRWQGVPAPLGPELAPTAQRAKLHEMRDLLHPDTPNVDLEERTLQLAARRHAPSRK